MSARPVSGWWRRAAALVLDTLIISALTTGLLWVGGYDVGAYYADEGSVWFLTRTIEVVNAAAYTAVAFAYEMPQLLRRGQTLGKRALAIRVERADGRPLDLRTLLVRQTLVQYVSGFLALPILIANYLWPLLTRDNRALHDLAAGTLVVRCADMRPAVAVSA